MKTNIFSLVLAMTGSLFADTAKPNALLWVDPAVAVREDADFSVQGEYRNEGPAAMGAQIVALGHGKFDLYLLEGGLPGDGWEPGKPRYVLAGERKGEAIAFQNETLTLKALLEEQQLRITDRNEKHETLKRVERKSPTLGAKPPEGAVVLFDGSSADAWDRGVVKENHLQATNCFSKQHFGDYQLHVEFRTPYKPLARGQQRGNSGIYMNGRWETQVLDSFGLEGRDNECGGVYSLSKPRLNMCFPPLSWQTYDVDFTAAKFDADGKRIEWPRVTVRLNGVVVHDDLELKKDFTASAPFSKPLDSATGPVFLQDHGNPVVYRNLWVLPRKPVAK
ncbi:MAG: hypothetical protein RLZZ553_447 [Verrucomicrobiota bacterium]|jgi:hypothetical protein